MPQENRISLQDIAARANVSKATVSLSLKSHPRISEATRERVLKIAKELGYRPDPKLSELMATMKREPSADQGTIAFIRSGLTTKWEPMEKFFFDEVTEGAATYGYQVEPYWIYDPRESPKRINNTMWNRGIDGVIIPMVHPDRFNQGVRTLPIEWEKFCTVEIADTIQEPRLSGIRHNHYGGMLQTLSELEALGYTKIGFTMESDVELRTHHRWTAAYMLWKSMRGFHECLPLHFPIKHEEKPLLEWIEKADLEVVISPGVEVYQMLKDNGMCIPKDIAFATLHQWGEGSDTVTGINQNMPAQSRIAVDMLVGLIHRRAKGVPKHPILATAPGYWSQGSTTRRPKRGHTVKPLDNEPLNFF
jgi:DNA-binding LacI/PurR family transcriptional regulator